MLGACFVVPARAAPPRNANHRSTTDASSEPRRWFAIPAWRIKHAFPGIAAVARITSRRRLTGRPADEPLVRYFLLSKHLPARRLLHIVRSHWGIENQLHWVLDVAFDEDANRARKDNAPENLAVLRSLALNIIRSHPDQASIRRKIKRAGWDDAFLLSMLSQMR